MASSSGRQRKAQKRNREEGEEQGASATTNESDEKFTFFFGAESPFSQWHYVTFTVDGVQYNCAEQYMMHQKAVLFGDEAMASEIMNADHPGDQKALGRKVNNFDDKKWGASCKEIVKRGNMAKFSQNAELGVELMSTRGTTLVEAAPRDTVWGIGLSAKNWKAQHREHWRGKNLLGEILTEVREELAAKQDTNAT